MNPAPKVIGGSLLAILVLIGLLSWNPRHGADRTPGRPLLVYCAAGLKGPVERVARDYERRTGIPVQLQYGGSGLLLSNLRVARRGDLYLAADHTYLDAGRSNGLVAEVLPLARMRAVIAVPAGNPRRIQSAADLAAAPLQLGWANVESTAVGRLSQSVLRAADLWDAIFPRIKVFKPTVNDVANDVKLGAVDAGVVWDATLVDYPKLEAVAAPELEPAEAGVAVGVLTFSEQPTEALRFARFLGARDAGLPAFSEAGFRVVAGDQWSERPEVVLYSGGVNRIAIEESLREFEAREGVSVTRVYNGCGILTAQIRSGQRPDAYFACDVSFMTTVATHFEPPTDLSETRMVLLTQPGNPRDLRILADLAKPGLAIGVANEQQSALGALTARLLRAEGLFDAVMANVRVQAPTADLLVNQLRAGGLDAVVVYAANTRQVRDLLTVIELPQEAALAIQPYAVGRDSNNAHLMERLLEWLKSGTSRRRFEDSGFRWRAVGEAP